MKNDDINEIICNLLEKVNQKEEYDFKIILTLLFTMSCNLLTEDTNKKVLEFFTNKIKSEEE